MSVVWRESDLEEEADGKGRIALVMSLDTQVSPSPKHSAYKQLAIEQIEIITIL